MATRHLVRMADLADTAAETTVRCTCGWSVTLAATTSERAVRLAARTRAEHLDSAHPAQRGAHDHDLLVGGSVKDGYLWTRHAACGCGTWALTVTERTPDQVASTARARHREHLAHETGRPPARDYVVMLALLAVVAVVLVAVSAAAIHAGGR